MQSKFSVTYEIITEESAQNGDFAESGFLLENVGLREAIKEFHVGYVKPSCSPIQHNPYVWFTAYGEMNISDGSYENRSLHCPKNITPSSHKRVAQLIGLKVK